MLTVNFKNLREHVPEVKKGITYVVAKNPLIMATDGFDADGLFYTGTCYFDWFGVDSCGMTSCCYDYDVEEHNKQPIGYETKFLSEGETDPDNEYETFRKVMYLDSDLRDSSNTMILPFTSENPQDDMDIEIFWEYTHKIRYEACKQTQLGQDSFPTPFIKEMLEDGMLSIIGTPELRDIKCEHSGYEYKHVSIAFMWCGNVWIIKGSQEGHWSESAWVDGQYAEMSVFSVKKVKV